MSEQQLHTAILHAQAEIRGTSDSLLPSQRMVDFSKHGVPLAGTATEVLHQIRVQLHRLLVLYVAAVDSNFLLRSLDQLPISALVRIAIHLDLTTRFAFAQTSRRIRGVLNSHPQLWATVYISDAHWDVTKSDNWTKPLLRVLQLARSEPIHLMLVTAIHRSSALLWDKFEEVNLMDRVGSLVLNLRPLSVWEADLSQEAFSAKIVADACALRQNMRNLLQQPAPMLELAQIVDPGYSNVEHFVPENLFGDHAPLLRRLWLNGYTLVPGSHYAALSLVTSFNFTAGFNDQPLTGQQLRMFLEAMPLLVFLGLEGRICSYISETDHGSPLDRSGRPILQVTVSGISTGLRDLVADITGNASFEANLGGVPEIGDRFDICDFGVLDITFGQLFTRTQGSSKCTVTNCHRRCIINSGPVMKLGEGSPLEFVLPIQRSSEMVSISIHECQWWMIEDYLLDFPSVKELYIILQTCFEHAQGAVGNIFLTPHRKASLGELFPSLQRISICSGEHFWQPTHQRRQCFPYPGTLCACERGCIVSLHDINSLVAQALSSSERLKELVISGIGAVTDVIAADEFCELLTLVDSFNSQLHPPRGLIEAVNTHSSYECLTRTELSLSLHQKFDGFLLNPVPHRMLQWLGTW